MNTPNSRWTNVHSAGIDPTLGHPGAQTAFGDADRTRTHEFLHEGIHHSSEESRAFGAMEAHLGDEPLQTDHQGPYDAAAEAILGQTQ